jgi:serine/threonine-protein kinase
VKKVQQANIPAISQINRRVPPELERIVNRTLAKDPHARYQTARELGQDLAKFMFSYGQAVSSFDVATVVQSTMREKQRVRPPQGSIIDKLIEEALFEFTSLKEEDGQPPQPNAQSQASAHLQQFVNPTDWANEIALHNKQPGYDPLRASLPPEVFDHGNLSALEDDDAISSGPHGSVAPQSVGGQAPARRSGGHPVAKSGGGASGAIIGVAIFLVVAVAAGAMWFTGMFRHH